VLPALEFCDTPTVKVRTGREYLVREMVALLQRLAPDFAAIERSQPFPRMGGVAAFKLGYGYGLWVGLLATLGIPYETVRPNDWKREFGLLSQEKGASRVRAQELFPAATKHLTLIKHHNRADALLIAQYGLRHHNNPLLTGEGVV